MKLRGIGESDKHRARKREIARRVRIKGGEVEEEKKEGREK